MGIVKYLLQKVKHFYLKCSLQRMKHFHLQQIEETRLCCRFITFLEFLKSQYCGSRLCLCLFSCCRLTCTSASCVAVAATRTGFSCAMGVMTATTPSAWSRRSMTFPRETGGVLSVWLRSEVIAEAAIKRFLQMCFLCLWVLDLAVDNNEAHDKNWGVGLNRKEVLEVTAQLCSQLRGREMV